MQRRDIRRIIAERLASWSTRMEGRHATPIVLLGIGHDHAEGDVVICCLQDGPTSDPAVIAGLLRHTADLIEAGRF